MVSSNAAAYGGDTLAQHRTAIDAAKAAGVGRIVYTSHMGVSATSAFPPMRSHHATEEMLRSSGIAYTTLRNGFYASTIPRLLGNAAQTGVVEAAQDGKVSWTTHADLARAAARILTEPGRFEGATPPLTASAALDLGDLAKLLAERLGRSIERRTLSDADEEARLARLGLPAAVIQITLGMHRASRAGEFAAVDPTLKALIGRPPQHASTQLPSPGRNTSG